MTSTAVPRSMQRRAMWLAGNSYRRRWARRGRGLADFTFAFILASAAHTLGALWSMITWMAGRALHRSSRSPSRSAVRTYAHGNLMTPNWDGGTFTALATKPTTRFDAIAGLEDAKREVRLRMILPALHPMEAKRYGVRQGGGLLLFGPPGTGKTMLAKAVAAEIDAAFYHVKPSDVMAASVGNAEANVKALFEAVRRERRAVLFIDEIEALVPRRRRNGSTIMRRVVSQFLMEVDGLEKAPAEHTLLLVGATNEVEMVDPAMLRPGRFDAKIRVGLPDQKARRQILEAAASGKPLGNDVDFALLARLTESLTGADLTALVGTATDRAFLRAIAFSGQTGPIQMQDFLAGLPVTMTENRPDPRDQTPCQGAKTAPSGPKSPAVAASSEPVRRSSRPAPSDSSDSRAFGVA